MLVGLVVGRMQAKAKRGHDIEKFAVESVFTMVLPVQP